MSNTSNKHRNKKIRNISLVAFVVLLIGSFIVSRGDKKVDPSEIVDVEIYPIVEHVKGNTEAGILLVEYSDFQCPACENVAPVLSGLIENFGDQFAIEYRHFPLRQIHPNAQIAAQAAEAAGIQGKFWEMHDLLFEKQSEWSRSVNPKRYFYDYAESLGINEDRFKLDLESDEVKERVNGDFDDATAFELPGTPAFMFNGEIIDLNTFVQENLIPVSVPSGEVSDEAMEENEPLDSDEGTEDAV